MISILIPTYNFNCRPLVEELRRQATAGKYPFEIIVADDGSTFPYRKINAGIGEIDHCRYVQLQENIGPARIRNLLVSLARYRFCLLMDADTFPAGDSFIEKYAKSAQAGSVVCGGFIYKRGINTGVCPLRLKYGIEVEEKDFNARNNDPYGRFISMCFLADKEIFQKVSFNEKMHFGYEDACFGMELKEKHVPIIHIDNPVFHLSTENAEAYLCKIEQSIRNIVPHMERMRPCIRLLAWQGKIEKYRLTGLVGLVFRLSRPFLHHNLTGRHPSLHCFAFYKLGYLCRILAAGKRENRGNHPSGQW